MDLDRQLVTMDNGIQEQMNLRVMKDMVRSRMRSNVVNSGDFDFSSITTAEWVSRYTRLGENPFKFDEHPYQIDILNDQAHKVYVMKAAQMGISETMARGCIAKLCQFDRTKALYTLPTDDDVSIFSKTRIKPVFEDSPAISQWMEKTSTDNVTQKQIKSSFLLLRGGWDVKKMQMMDIDFLYVDELDRQKPEIIGSMRTRMDHSAYRYEYGYSTPTIEGFGIHALYEQTDQKEWFIKCTRCEEEQFITYENIMYYPSDEARTDPYFGCRRCKAKLNRFKGEWKPTADGKVGSGYHITQAMSPRQTAAIIVEKRGDYLLDSDYWNYVWGLPHKAGADDPTGKVDYESLVGDYDAAEAVPRMDDGPIRTMSVDWGHPWSWAEIREIDVEAGKSKVLWIECFHNDNPDHHPERMIELARNNLCLMVVGDIGYSNSHGFRMKETLGDLFWDVSSNCTGTIEPRYDLKKHRISCMKERIIKRHFVLLGNNRISIPKNSPMIKFGKDYKSCSELWVGQHKNIKIRKDREGNEEVVSVGADHLALTSSYDDLAFEYILRLRGKKRQQSGQMTMHVVGGRRGRR